MSNEDLLDIPPSLDRRRNGRCRAYWMAVDACPPTRNRYEWGTDHYADYLTEALELDKKEGPLPACPEATAPLPPRVRTRTRTRVRTRKRK